MGLLSKLGEFKVNGAIEAQWQTNLAVERFLIAQGKNVRGVTGWLITLEYIGIFLTFLLFGFLLSLYIILFTLRVLIKVGKFIYFLIYPDKKPKTNVELIQEDIDKMLSKNADDVNEFRDTTKEEEEMIANFY